MMTREGILTEVRRVTQDVLRDYSVEVYLFGSWASGTPRHSSDIDVGVYARRPLPAGKLATLRERLEESHIPYRVEVVDLAATDAVFRNTVVRHGIRWSA